MKTDYSSWKQKIDPAFPKIIKFILIGLKNQDLPSSSGWLEVNPIYVEKFQKKGYPGWIIGYEDKTIKNGVPPV